MVSGAFSLEKCGKVWENLPFFRAATAGLGKYHMGSYCRLNGHKLGYNFSCIIRNDYNAIGN